MSPSCVSSSLSCSVVKGRVRLQRCSSRDGGHRAGEGERGRSGWGGGEGRGGGGGVVNVEVRTLYM